MSSAAKEYTDVERSIHDWFIPTFSSLYGQLNTKSKVAARRSLPQSRKRKQDSTANIELVSDPFMRGQLVKKTSIWQLELRRNGPHLTIGLSCLKCFDESVDQIYVRFDVDIVDLNGDIGHSEGAALHYSPDNITKFMPYEKVRAQNYSRNHIGLRGCNFWEVDLISISDLEAKWSTLVARDMLNLRLRMYVYLKKPLDEGSFLADYDEPVKIVYHDHLKFHTNSDHPTISGIKRSWATREQNGDVTFMVKGNCVKAHKTIMSWASPVLQDLIATQKDKTGPIELKGPLTLSLSLFVHLLNYIYNQEFPALLMSTDLKFTVSVLDASNYLGLTQLSRICKVRLLENMTIENFGQTAVAIYSKTESDPSFFRSEVKKFLMKNQTDLRKSAEFQKIALENKGIFLQLCFEQIPLPIPAGDN